MQDNTPKSALVTGATGAIGEAIALGLARDGFDVTIVGRDERKTAATAERIARQVPAARVSQAVADLSRQRSVLELAESWSGPLNVLVNNAAIAPPRREETPEGIERQFATNVLSYVWLAEALRGALALGAPARIVNVASYWAGDLELDDLEFRRRRYDNNTAYRQSKQANRMLTVLHAEKFAADRISVNSCHPGDVNSTLSNSLGFGGSESPASGAATPLWLATSSSVADVTGGYFARRERERDPFADDRRSIEALYACCRERSE